MSLSLSPSPLYACIYFLIFSLHSITCFIFQHKQADKKLDVAVAVFEQVLERVAMFVSLGLYRSFHCIRIRPMLH
jgi:hypothetical protein